MAADPIADFVSSFRDPAKWVAVRNVPVCRPHERATPGGTVRVTAADLPDVAAAVNAPWAESGTPVRVTLGHVLQDPKAAETDQPPLVGFALNAGVGSFGPAKVPAVTVDLYIRRDRAVEVLRQFPFRSMEFDPATKRIHGVALLVRDPWLDLGAIHYAGGGWRVTYEGKRMADDADDFTEDEKKSYARCAKYLMKHYARLREYMAEPSATNGDPAQYQKDPAIDAKVKELEAKLAAEQAARVEESAKRLLEPLKPAVKFDYARELKTLVGLPDDAARAAHAEYMLGTYQKLPTGGGPIPVAARGANPAGKPDRSAPLSEPEYKRALAYQAEKKCDWPAAIEAVKGQRA